MINLDAIKSVKQQVGDLVTIVAATKTVDADRINQLKSNGIFIAGENRVQEFLTKYDKVSGMDWHFIGQLQTNKVRSIVDKVSMIQSVDRANLADEIQRQCAKIGKTMDVLIEVNLGEQAKGGVSFDEISALAAHIDSLPNLRLCGVMSVPPIDAKKSDYLLVKDVFDSLCKSYKTVKTLSMGMSGDYKIAVECGANMIRLGSILFGDRL